MASHFHQDLFIDRDQLDYLNRILRFIPANHIIGNDYDSLYASKDPLVREFTATIICDHPLFENRTTFPDGKRMTIGVYPPADAMHSATAHALLDDTDGKVLARSDEEYYLNGTWELRAPDGTVCSVRIRRRQQKEAPVQFHTILPIMPESLLRLNRLMVSDAAYSIRQGRNLCIEEIPFPSGNTVRLSVRPPKSETEHAFAEAELLDRQMNVLDSSAEASQLERNWELWNGNEVYTIDVRQDMRGEEAGRPDSRAVSLFRAVLSVEPEKLEQLNQILAMPFHEYLDHGEENPVIREASVRGRDLFPYIGLEDPFPFWSEGIEFPDGNSARIEVYPPKDWKSSPYAKATLLDAHGKELDTDSSRMGYPLNGHWLLSNGSHSYMIDVIGKVRESREEPSCFHAALFVEPEQLDRLNCIMAFEAYDYVAEGSEDRLREMDTPEVREFVESCGQKRDLFHQEIPFPNGTHAEIIILPPESLSEQTSARAFLYDAGGAELAFTDPYSKLDQSWCLQDAEGATYNIDIREKRRAVDLTPRGKHLHALRDAVFQTLRATIRLEHAVIFPEERKKIYVSLAEDLPRALDSIMEELEKHAPQKTADLLAGRYLYTGRLDQIPFREEERQEASRLIPALYTFVNKMQTVQSACFLAGQDELLGHCIPKDVVMYLDAARALECAAPKLLDCQHLLTGISLRAPGEEEDDACRRACSRIEWLRGRITEASFHAYRNEPERSTSDTELVMQSVYTKSCDTVDYDRLNLEAARLLLASEDSRALEELAGIARELDPSIRDTRAYARNLEKQARRRPSR